MVFDIQIGNYKLGMLEKVVVDRSVEQLADTAVITLPGTAYNKTLDVESKIKRGDKIAVQFGYDNSLVDEFDGYLESIHTDDESITINCEDPIFLYRVALDNIELKAPTVKSILDYVNQKVSAYYPNDDPFTLNCDYDFSYDKFVINNATGYDVLKQIQDEAKPNVYLKGHVLHVHPQYSQIFGSAVYDFSVNIDSEGCELKYRDIDERKLMIEVEAKGKDGKVVKIDVGSIGGDKETLKISGVTNIDSLKKLAQERLNQKAYTGLEGSFKSWLVPYCDAGYKAKIIDKDYEYKNGWYYVLGVKTEFSKNADSREIKLGKKLSDG
jgi:hypothetical protein